MINNRKTIIVFTIVISIFALRAIGEEDIVANEKYVGSEACKKCHASEYNDWKNSRHADAFAILEAGDADNNDYCLKCHTVNFDGEGYVEQNVGCESCHGGGSDHVSSNGVVHTTKKANASETCTDCHQPQWSPNFVFDEFWQMEKH